MHNIIMYMYDGASPSSRSVLPLVQDMIRNSDVIAEYGNTFSIGIFKTGYSIIINNIEVKWYDENIIEINNNTIKFKYHEVYETAKYICDYVIDNLEN